MLRRTILLCLLAGFGYLVGTELESHRAPTLELTFAQNARHAQMSPDGQNIAVLGLGTGGEWFFELWTQKGKLLGKRIPLPPPPGRHHSVSWREDSREVAVAAGNDVWLISTQSLEKRVLKAAPMVRQVQFQAQTLMARSNTAVFCWNTRTRKQIWRLDQNHLLQATLDPKGGKLATGCFQDGVRVFDIGRKRQLIQFSGGMTSCGLRFGRGGGWLTSGFRNRNQRQHDSVVTIDLKTKKPISAPIPTPFLEGFELCNDGINILARCRDTVTFYRTADGRAINSLEGTARLIDAVNEAGTWIASALAGENASSCRAWNLSSGKTHILSCAQPPQSLSFGSGGRLLVVDGQVNLWKVAD